MKRITKKVKDSVITNKNINTVQVIEKSSQIKTNSIMIEEELQMISTKIAAQQQLIDLLTSQVIDLTMMSKIELGDDVIAEIKRLKDKIKTGEL